MTNSERIVMEAISTSTRNITNIPTNKLHDFEGHPYKVDNNEEMQKLVDSIKEQGVISPIVVRRKDNTADEYEVISGHRRLFASRVAGLSSVPAVVLELDKNEAAIAVVDSNLHREQLLPSEKAFAYKMKMEALKAQGRVGGQVGHKSRDCISDTDSGRQVQRYIRLTYLIPELLHLVDKSRIAFSVGVELSYLSEQEQADLFEAIDMEDKTPSLSQAMQLKKLSLSRKLDSEIIVKMICEDKPNQREKISFNYEDISKYFPSQNTQDIYNRIMKLVEDDYRKRIRRQNRDER